MYSDDHTIFFNVLFFLSKYRNKYIHIQTQKMVLQDLKEDKEWFIKACIQMKKQYDEQSRLVKQNLKIDQSLFVNHMVLRKQFVISYVQPFPGCSDQMVFTELAHFINPDQFRNGVLVISSE